MFHVEILAIIVGSIGSVVGFLTYLWKRLVKPLVKLVQNHDVFIKSVDELREVMQKELSTNGGNSLKDAIIDLRQTCHRIEKRQKIIEQRTKAALHYSNVALFETDIAGRLVWSNVHLSDFLDEETGADVQGYDWLTIINEDEREEVLSEFKSCLNMNRKFSKITQTTDGKNIRMLGYPYRLNSTEHGGFLVSIIENNEV
tara:strand:+ start:885 stop:1484 length:600 start_codon:yes stop_codon:yes gene_type:complete